MPARCPECWAWRRRHGKMNHERTIAALQQRPPQERRLLAAANYISVDRSTSIQSGLRSRSTLAHIKPLLLGTGDDAGAELSYVHMIVI